MQQIRTTVTIFGKECEIAVFGNDKGTWWARGYYEEQYIEGRSARTYESAVRNWKRKAEMYTDY